jgi:hypothetical protein
MNFPTNFPHWLLRLFFNHQHSARWNGLTGVTPPPQKGGNTPPQKIRL